MRSVPLNRPEAFERIELLAKELPDDALIVGATMLTQTDVDSVYAAGGWHHAREYGRVGQGWGNGLWYWQPVACARHRGDSGALARSGVCCCLAGSMN